MHSAQIDITYIVCTIIVLDKAAGLVKRLKDKFFGWLDPASHWNIRMPAVMDLRVVIG